MVDINSGQNSFIFFKYIYMEFQYWTFVLYAGRHDTPADIAVFVTHENPFKLEFTNEFMDWIAEIGNNPFEVTVYVTWLTIASISLLRFLEEQARGRISDSYLKFMHYDKSTNGYREQPLTLYHN